LHLSGGDLVSLPDIGYGARRSARGRAGIRLAVAGASRVIASSHFVVDQARALGIPAERVPFGVALEKWPPCPPRQRERKAPARLLHVAHLSPVKDQEMLLRAAARLAARGIAFELEMIGKDVMGGAIQRRAFALGLADRVRFAGVVPNHALRPR